MSNQTYDDLVAEQVDRDAVEIHRNGALAAVIGVAGAALAIAWFGRAVQDGGAVNWVTFVVVAVVAVAWLRAFVDARTPLLVADQQGVRMRLGQTWHGLPWRDLERVDHLPRRGLLRDGQLRLEPLADVVPVAGVGLGGRLAASLNRRILGTPLAVPLGITTRVPSLDVDLTVALRRLAAGQTAVVEVDGGAAPADAAGTTDTQTEEPTLAVIDGVEPDPVEQLEGHRAHQQGAVEVSVGTSAASLAEDPTPAEEASTRVVAVEVDEQPPAPTRIGLRLRRGLAALVGGHARTADPELVEEADAVEDIAPVVGPRPTRELRAARRSDVVSAPGDELADAPALQGRELRRAGSVNLVVESAAVEPVVPPAIEVEEVAPAAAPDPVIGPELAAARERLGLSVDTLAERTRIRPHVIEAIEVDDFGPCGGDFYARGHLRTLARVLGIDAAPLVTSYDERYADAPIAARKVFEAELAAGTGGLRSTSGGPRWSVLVAAAMAVVLAWSVARLLMDDAKEVQQPAISLSQGSGGPNSAQQPAQRVTVKVSALSSSSVKVVNKRGNVVFSADLVAGDIHRIDVVAPVTIEASDGGAVEVEIDGDPRGTLGKAGQPGSRTYRVAR